VDGVADDAAVGEVICCCDEVAEVGGDELVVGVGGVGVGVEGGESGSGCDDDVDVDIVGITWVVMEPSFGTQRVDW
jgi:hypothetical protein